MKPSAWWLVAMAVAPAFGGLWSTLQDVDPAQYADVSRRMLESGQWLELRDMNGPFLNKPPMAFWAQAVCMALLGATSVAARLPSLLFGIAALAGTYWAGRSMKDARLGAMAAALVGSSVAFHLMIADPKVDMPLMAFSTLAVAAALASVTTRQGEQGARGFGSMAIWLAWAFAGLAVLSKGPIGLALPVLALLPLLRAGGLQALRPLRGLLIVLAIIAPFYVAVAVTTGVESAKYLLLTQTVGRFGSSTEFRNDLGPFFFLHTALWAFLPFIPLTIAGLVRHRRELTSNVAMTWLLLPLILISAASFKLPHYLYWLTPPAALIAARELSEPNLRWHWFSRALAIIGVVAATFTLLFVFQGSPLWLVPAIAAAIAAHRIENVGHALVATMSAAMLFLHGHVMPSLLTYQPFEALGTVVRAQEPTRPEIPVAAMNPSFALAFYARRDARYVSPNEMLELVKSTGPRLMVLGPDELPTNAFESLGLTLKTIDHTTGYATSRPGRTFLDASTRAEALSSFDLVQVSLAPSPP